MEAIPCHPLVIVTQEDLKKVRQSCDVNDVKRIQDSLDTIEEWMKKQPHLAEAGTYISRSILERVYLLAKGSVEETKNRIEKMLTSRGMMPELCMKRSIEEFYSFWNAAHYIPLPKLHPVDQSRVMVTQFLNGKLDDFSLVIYLRYSFMIGEYRLNFDYSPSERYIIDMRNIHIGHLSKLNPVVLKKAEVLCTEGFGTKIKGIHILNAPPFVDKLMFLLKQALSEKVASRVHVHSNNADLQKHVPKEILPKDYDGDDQSVEKLSEQWTEVLKADEARRLIKEMDKLVSDESKRSAVKFNEEYLGMPGSFRRLTVD